jgi:pyruvate formate lyase activating enzyme
LGPDVPIHFTRFHPEYLLKSLPSTPVASLERGYDIAKAEGLHFPYIGNVPGHKGENTFCPGCGAELIVRRGFQVSPKSMKDGRCEKCGYRLPGVWA